MMLEQESKYIFHELPEDFDFVGQNGSPFSREFQFFGSKCEEMDEGEEKGEQEKKRGNSIVKRKGSKKSKSRKYRKKSDSDFEMNSGQWTREESKKYHRFLEIHTPQFFKKELRRVNKIFKLMATYMETRIPEQCRSHHQKMQKKYHSFQRIIQQLRMEFFGSCDPALVKEDLSKIGINLTPELLTEEELVKGRKCDEQSLFRPEQKVQTPEDASFFENMQRDHQACLFGQEEYEKNFPTLNFN